MSSAAETGVSGNRKVKPCDIGRDRIDGALPLPLERPLSTNWRRAGRCRCRTPLPPWRNPIDNQGLQIFEGPTAAIPTKAISAIAEVGTRSGNAPDQ
jgi:hypothetical protein